MNPTLVWVILALAAAALGILTAAMWRHTNREWDRALTLMRADIEAERASRPYDQEAP